MSDRARPRLGVGITTRNRPAVLGQCLAAWQSHLPDGAVLVVVDDASDPPVESAYRFETNAGVARVKNKALALLDAAGCEEFFLADDDCWPVSPDWWRPYVASQIPHLAYLWGGRVIEARDGWVAKNVFHGCLLYAHKTVLETVGGMRTEFGAFGYEHVEWSRRINACGLTPHRYMDIDGSDRLWRSLDKEARAGGAPHASSMGARRKRIAAQNLPILAAFTGSTDYVEFREA